MSPLNRPPSLRHGDRLCARSVLFLLLALYTATFTGLSDNPDAEVEFQTTSALARGRGFALGGTPEAEGILFATRHDGSQGFNVAEGRDGQYYSWFGVGQALVGLPFYWAGDLLERVFPEVEAAHRATTHYGVGRSEYFQHLLVGWRNPLFSALTAWVLVLGARRLGVSRRAAWVSGMTYGLTTFAWPQARSTLSDVQATFFLLLAFGQVLKVREVLRHRKRPRALDLFVLGTALGLAFLTRVLTAPAILVLGVAWFLVERNGWKQNRVLERLPLLLWRDLAWGALPALALLGVFLVTNAWRFGDPLETGYGEAVFSGSFFSYPPHYGLAGLLVAPGKGLLWLAPGALLSAWGIARGPRQGERLYPLVLVGMALAVIGPVACTATWHGAWTYGPRYLLPLLPFLWLGVALGLEVLRRSPAGMRLACALFLLGLATNLPGVLVDHMTHQDLALEAARLEWPDVEGGDDDRFQLIQWDPRFAAPWAHWRILRHRVAGLGEEFPVRRLFLLGPPPSPPDARVQAGAEPLQEPTWERDRGFQHFGWVDLVVRLGGSPLPGFILTMILLYAGAILAVRGLDPALV